MRENNGALKNDAVINLVAASLESDNVIRRRKYKPILKQYYQIKFYFVTFLKNNTTSKTKTKTAKNKRTTKRDRDLDPVKTMYNPVHHPRDHHNYRR